MGCGHLSAQRYLWPPLLHPRHADTLGAAPRFPMAAAFSAFVRPRKGTRPGESLTLLPGRWTGTSVLRGPRVQQDSLHWEGLKQGEPKACFPGWP